MCPFSGAKFLSSRHTKNNRFKTAPRESRRRYKSTSSQSSTSVAWNANTTSTSLQSPAVSAETDSPFLSAGPGEAGATCLVEVVAAARLDAAATSICFWRGLPGLTLLVLTTARLLLLSFSFSGTRNSSLVLCNDRLRLHTSAA